MELSPLTLLALGMAAGVFLMIGADCLKARLQPRADPEQEQYDRDRREIELALGKARLTETRLQCRRLRQLIREDRGY